MLNSILLVAISFLTSILSPVEAQGLPFGKKAYQNGPYYFVACTKKQGPQLVDLFARTGQALEQQIIPEANKVGSRAFNTFFSSNTPSVIANVFSDIDHGPSVRSIDQTPVTRPAVMCVNKNNPHTTEAYNACLQTGYLAFKSSAANYLFLCPGFFNPPVDYFTDFPNPTVCPFLNGAETSYVTSGHGRVEINQNRMAAIIHELAHWYSADIGPETYLINECIYASAQKQAGNPDNYAFFASSKWLLSLRNKLGVHVGAVYGRSAVRGPVGSSLLEWTLWRSLLTSLVM